MADPANSIKRSGSRWYVDPVSQEKVPSVTSICGMLPKKALQYWRSKKVAESAVEDFGVVADLIARGNPTAAIDHLKRAPDRFSGEAASIGTDVHDLCERLSTDQDIGAVHPDLKGFVDSYRQFIVDFEPGFLEVEATAWSEEFGYAGTLDWIAVIDAEVVIGDIKTGASGAWPDVALQLQAYARADYLLDAQGERRPLPAIEAAAVLSLRPEGYKLYPVRLGDDVFDTFKALLEVFKWESETSKTVLGKSPVEPFDAK
mgnify:FL=1